MDLNIISSALDVIELVAVGLLKFVWDSLNKLKQSNIELKNELQKIELTFTKNFVPKEDIDKNYERLLKRIEKIEDKS